MDVKNKQTIKLSFMNPSFIVLLILIILLISTNCQQNKLLFNSSYYLLSQSDKIFIPINQSTFNLSNNGTSKFLKVQVKIQTLNQNGTYIDSSFQTANILVKYWKNHQNTQATNILAYSYEKLSVTKQFPTAFDPNDGGIVDIESLYNYKNEHSFLHIMGNETSDILFVIGIYRFANNGLTDILGMSKKSDEIKVTITVIRGTQSDNRCQLCSSKQFCPTNQCFCSQQLYSGCNVNRKKITTNVDKSTKMNDKGLINKGQIHHVQIQPQTNQKQWFPVQISLSLQNSNSSINKTPKKDKIFLLLYVQNKNDTFETIPNIYNFDFIDSPSLNSRIISQLTVSSTVTDHNQPINVRSDQNSISITERILVSKNQLIAVAIYYLNDTQGSSTTNSDSLSVSMNIDFSNSTNQISQGQSVVNLALVIGMIVLGLFLLILLVCVLHFFVSKRFSFLSIFNHMQNSNRNSVNSGRQSRNENNQDRKLSLPTVSFDFLNDLVFKPLKYIYQTSIQQNYSKFTSETKKFSQQNQMCSICLEQFTNESKIKYTYCGHILDSKCLESWLEKEMSCPMCRQKLQPKDVAQYEDRILQQIVQNDHYQSIIDEEAQTLKNMYKNWKNNKNKDNFRFENTQQSLVNNQHAVSSKFIQNSVIPNISTMVELQKTDFNLKESMNKKTEESPSLVLMKPSNTIHLNRIFFNNQQFSVKRFSKNYLFYRCIFLHHKINKNFDNNSDMNLYASDMQVEKNHSIFCQSKRQNQQSHQNTPDKKNKIVNLVQMQPCIIKPFHQKEQYSLDLYVNSAMKINHQLLEQQLKKNKNSPQISLYLETDHLSNEVEKLEKSKIYRDLSDSQIEKSSQQKSSDPDHSKSGKINKRKNKRLTIREEMNQLQRQLQQSQKKYEPIEQNMKFSEKAGSIIFFEESQDQNIRYAAPVSIVSGQNKSQSSKNCTINKTEVLILPHTKKLPTLGQQTLKTLPYSICLNHQPLISYRKISQHQQKQRFAKKKIDLEQI